MTKHSKLAQAQAHLKSARDRNVVLADDLKEASDRLMWIENYLRKARADGLHSDQRIVDNLLKTFATGNWAIILEETPR